MRPSAIQRRTSGKLSPSCCSFARLALILLLFMCLFP
nr:MAG TPA: hypothetical protein [Caudoviricetes sp.]DAO15811.1 MAG TPA: hypothetical protein [Caudoviricetes sp.]